ncbi:MAG: Hsp70 family protein [candidate division WOR-3 bacterium]
MISVGIDLGTTNTVVAYWDARFGEGNPTLLDIPQPRGRLNSFEFQDHLPSFVYLKDSQTAYVGQFLRDHYGVDPEMMIFRSIKKRMGKPWYCIFEDKRWTAPMISALILKAAAQTLKEQGLFIRNPIVTVPASFNSDQRLATLEAARLAGFDVEEDSLIDEPVASLIYYIWEHQHRFDEEERNLMVVDMGGGTLDVSILKVQRDANGLLVDTIGRSRYNELAGDDMDEALAALALGIFEADTGIEVRSLSDREQRRILSELLRTAEDAKIRLMNRVSNEERSGGTWETLRPISVPFSIPNLWSGQGVNFPLTLQLFTQAVVNYFNPDTDKNIHKPIEEAFEAARRVTRQEKFSEADIHELYVTGGSALLYQLRAVLQQRFGKKPRLIDPMHSVALGACIYHHWRSLGETNVRFRQRLLENIYLRQKGGKGAGFACVVPMEIEIPPGGVSGTTPYDETKLSLPNEPLVVGFRACFYRGTKVDDPQLAPLDERIIEFDEPIEGGRPIDILWEIDENKTLKIIFIIQSSIYGEVRKQAKVQSPDIDPRLLAQDQSLLCTVNPAIA